MDRETTTGRIPPSVKPALRRTFTWALATGLVMATLLAATGQAAMARGLALGTLFGTMDLLWMARSLPARLGGGAVRARARAFGFVAARYGVKAIPLVASVKLAQIDFSMTVLGLFLVPACLMAGAMGRR